MAYYRIDNNVSMSVGQWAVEPDPDSLLWRFVDGPWKGLTLDITTGHPVFPSAQKAEPEEFVDIDTRMTP